MVFEFLAFYLFAFLTIGAFYITVTTSHSLYALTALAAGMILISAFYFMLNADFMGVVQLIVYAGAVMALYSFGMMFFDTTRELHEKKTNSTVIFGLSVMATLVTVAMIAAPVLGANIEAHYPIDAAIGNSQAIGLVLFTKYLVPFEVAAVMLLVAMIAGIVLAGKKMDASYSELSEEEIDSKNAEGIA
ncbi:NADH-ubiquinone oxidoreductase chain J [hydrothermal vent metagenome]|uniref:NADH-ubiquinone oxidoreductase chain J n=1 Tax=hydrothermal vent metagenome TaxID=652676 RepID=A0A1W1BWZ3_9ZZZZ